MLWGIQYILSQNIDRAGNMNLLATIAKIIGFTMFIVITLFIFNASNFGDGQSFMNEAGQSISLGGQINSAAIATLWAFIGIESAVMLSNRAKSQRDVKKATIFGLIIALLIYMSITLLTMGALPQDALKESQKPLVDALNLAIGNKGAYIMALLALVSLFGSTVGWIVVSSEVPYQAAKNGLFPKFFAKTNKKGSPSKSLFITNVMTQIFLFSTISGTVSEAYNFRYCCSNISLFNSIPCFYAVPIQISYYRRNIRYNAWLSNKGWDHYYISICILYLGYQNRNC
ncbi:amino acid permease [Bacillus sanguinis]